MNRKQKEFAVANFEKIFSESKATFLVNYRGLSVTQVQSLRRDLRTEGGAMRVTKARLMKIAAQNVQNNVEGLDLFKDSFVDQIALVYTQDDVSSIAKKLVDFSKNNEALEVLSVLFESKVLSSNDIKALASLPSREVLLGILARTMIEPVSGLARSLNLIIAKLLYALQEVAKNKKE